MIPHKNHLGKDPNNKNSNKIPSQTNPDHPTEFERSVVSIDISRQESENTDNNQTIDLNKSANSYNFDNKQGLIIFNNIYSDGYIPNSLTYTHYKEFDKNCTDYTVTVENVDNQWLELLALNQVRSITNNKERVMYLLNHEAFAWASPDRGTKNNYLKTGWFVPNGYYLINNQWQIIDQRGCFKPDHPLPDMKYVNPLGREKCEGRAANNTDIYTRITKDGQVRSGLKENALLDDSLIPVWTEELIEKFREYHQIKQQINSTVELIEYVVNHPEIPICICEGTSKKTLTQLKYLPYYFYIGVAGCNGILKKIGDSDYRLNEAIQPFVCKERKIAITFDFDEKITTVAKVSKAVKKAGKFLEKLGCQVFIPVWNNKQHGKGFDDVIYDCGVETAKNILDNAIEFKEYCQRFKGSENYGINLSNTDFVSNFKYLGQDENIKLIDLMRKCYEDGVKMLGTKAGMGVGKTVHHAELLTNKDIRSAYRILSLTHRESLQQMLSNQLGLIARNSIDNVKDIKRFYKEGGVIGLDSLSKHNNPSFQIDKWLDEEQKPFIIFWDEVKQGIKHLLTANTAIRQNRDEKVKNLIELLQNASFILVSDAHLTLVEMAFLSYLLEVKIDDVNQVNFLTDDSIDPDRFYKKLFENGKRDNYKILLGTFNIDDILDVKYHVRTGKLEHSFVELIALLGTGNKIAINWASCKNAKVLYQRLTELGYKGKLLLKETVGIIENFPIPPLQSNEQLEMLVKDLDFIIYSNVIETGLSIVKHPFNICYSFFNGVTDIESSFQQMNRFRNITEKYIYIASTPIKNKSIGQITSLSEMVNEVKSWKIGKINYGKQLKQDGFLKDADDLLRLENELFTNTDNKFFTLMWCLLHVNENREKQSDSINNIYYVDRVLNYLKEKVDKSQIEYVELNEHTEETNKIKQENKQAKEQIITNEIISEQNADLASIQYDDGGICKSKLDELDQRKSKYQKDADLARAGKIVHRTGVSNKDANYPLISRMIKDGLFTQLYRYYLMGYLDSEQRDKVVANKMKKQAIRNNFNPEMDQDIDRNYAFIRTITSSVELTKVINWLLTNTEVMCKNNPDSIKPLTFLLVNQQFWPLLKRLGITVTEKTTEIHLASRLLNLFGKDLIGKQVRIGERRQREYMVNHEMLVGLNWEVVYQIISNLFNRDCEIFGEEAIAVNLEDLNTDADD
jgi:Domain of unknown function (DUF3854)